MGREDRLIQAAVQAATHAPMRQAPQQQAPMGESPLTMVSAAVRAGILSSEQGYHMLFSGKNPTQYVGRTDAMVLLGFQTEYVELKARLIECLSLLGVSSMEELAEKQRTAQEALKATQQVEGEPSVDPATDMEMEEIEPELPSDDELTVELPPAPYDEVAGVAAETAEQS